ncbi:hypothetical protein HDU97_004601 [Phlyctochytrium planicorne]|nr:hypothetical protein HDU97_004601 [Phlyctochytrium planicorne]
MIGPDGKPCRVCDSFRSFSADTAKKDRPSTSSSHDGKSRSPSSSTPSSYVQCPPDSQELGAATWTFLHTMAAYYPETPTEAEQKTAKVFFRTFSKLYPCGYCASHLREELKTNPPQVDSNKSLNLWLCGIHNEVNERLGKPKFDCSKVWERWKDNPSCE